MCTFKNGFRSEIFFTSKLKPLKNIMSQSQYPQSKKLVKEFGRVVEGASDPVVISGDAALSISGNDVLDNTSAAAPVALTLGVGALGELKVVSHVGTGAQPVVLTAALLDAGAAMTTATFSAAGQSLLLVSTGPAWAVVSNVGTVVLA